MLLVSNLSAEKKILLEMLREFDNVCKRNHIEYCLFYGTLLGAVRHQGFIPWDDDIDIAVRRTDYERLISVLSSTENLRITSKIPEFNNDMPLMYTKLISLVIAGDDGASVDVDLDEAKCLDVFPLDEFPKNRMIGIPVYYFLSIIGLSFFGKTNHDYRCTGLMSASRLASILPIDRRTLLRIFKSVSTRWIGNGSNGLIVSSIFFKKYNQICFVAGDFSEIIMVPFEDLTLPIPIGRDRILKQIYGDYLKLPPEHERIPKHDSNSR